MEKDPIAPQSYMIKTYEHNRIYFLLLTFLIVTIPFLNKAFHIDDPLFVWSARQILSDPINFYGFSVNWYGYEMPAYLVIKNPPLASYYFATVAYFFGWHEVVFHCSVLLLALAALLGTHHLAGCFCSKPLLATTISAFTPLFLLSSTTVMCDVLMLSLWVWAIVFWIRGIITNKVWLQYLASFMVVLCTLTKYTGVSLIPLLFIFALAHKRSVGLWIFPLLISILGVFCYEYLTTNLYGFGLFSDAMLYSSDIKKMKTKSDIHNVIVGLSFLGGCLINAFLVTSVAWKRHSMIAWCLGVILSILILPLLGTLNNYQLIEANGIRWDTIVQVGAFMVSGAGLLALCAADFLNSRDEYGLILFAWIIGIFTFATFVNWTINARSLLPLAPAVGILAARRLERLSSVTTSTPTASTHKDRGQGLMYGETSLTSSSWLFSRLRPLSLPNRALPISLLLMALLAVSVTWADYRLAETSRDAAVEVVGQYLKAGSNLWFQGHWGFQYYMEKEGARPLDIKKVIVSPGDILVVPSNNTNIYSMGKDQITLIDTIRLAPSSWIATMSPALGAGFYWDAKGPLPFALGSVPPEEYFVFRFGNQKAP